MLIAYRPDIDGLRALAILPVVLFHSFPEALPGGFIGVDIFFVISGYLITRIILSDLDSGRFTLIGFWERRCRRILPALLFMLTVTTAVALAILLPGDLKQYGAMLAATALFFANMQLARDDGYFAPEFHDNPLLHTWSLAVEEQYYLLWPALLLALTWRMPRKYLPLCILALLAASLTYSQWAVRESPEMAFFGLPSRAFELLIGAVLAAVGPQRRLSPLLANILAWGGLVLIAGGFLFISGHTRFPGLTALIPCLGAACLILAGSGGSAATPVGRTLSSGVFVGIGRISYSWYLWHWPPLALAHYYFARPLTVSETLTLGSCSLAAAIFSWRFIERPFREHRAGLVFSRRAAPALASCMLAFLALGGALVFSNRLEERLSPEALAIQHAFPQDKVEVECAQTAIANGVRGCVFGARGSAAPATLAVWGDSHGTHYIPAIAGIADAYGVKGLGLTTSGCQPSVAPSFDNAKPQRQEECRRNNQATYAFLREHAEIRTVVIAGRWSFRNEPTADDLAKVGADLTGTVDALRGIGKQVVVMGEVPQLFHKPQTCVLKQLHLGVKIADCGFVSRTGHNPLGTRIWQLLEEMRDQRPDVVFFAPQDHLCDAQTCYALDREDGLPLYRDDNHLNRKGADFLKPFIEARIAPLLIPPTIVSQQDQPSLADAAPRHN